MKKCNQCSTLLDDNAKFCPQCGAQQSFEPTNENSLNASATAYNNQQANTYTPEQTNTFSPQQNNYNNGAMAENNIPLQPDYKSTSQNQFDAQQNFNAASQNQYDMPVASNQLLKKLPIIIFATMAAFIVCIGALACVFHKTFTNMYYKTFSSPASYYEHVEKANTHTLTSIFSKSYATGLEQLKQDTITQNVSYKLTLGSGMQTLLQALPMSGFSGLKDVSITGTTQQKGNDCESVAQLNINDVPFLTANTYLNYNTKEEYIQIPEINESYINLSKLLEEGSGENMDILFDFYKDTANKMPSAKDVETLSNRYIDLAIESHGTVKKSSANVKIGKNSKKLTVLTVTYEAEQAKDFIEALKKNVQDDKELKNIFEKVSKGSYSKFLKKVKEIDASDISTNGNSIKMMVYVDNNGNIVGRKFTLHSESNGDYSPLYYVTLQNGNTFHYSCTITPSADDTTEVISITGEGTRKKNIENSTYTLGVSQSIVDQSKMNTSYITDPSNLIIMEVKDFDLAASVKDGSSSGTFTFYTKAVPMLGLYKLKCVVNNKSVTDKNVEMSLLANQETLCTLTLQTDMKAKKINTIPANNANIMDMMDENFQYDYLADFDIETFLEEKLEKAGITIDSSTLQNFSYAINNVLNPYSMSSYDSYDDYDFDDYKLDDYTIDDDSIKIED